MSHLTELQLHFKIPLIPDFLTLKMDNQHKIIIFIFIHESILFQALFIISIFQSIFFLNCQSMILIGFNHHTVHL